MSNEFDLCFYDWRRAYKIRHSVLGDADSATRESLDLIGCVLPRMGVSHANRKLYLKKKLSKSISHEAKGDAYLQQRKYQLALNEYQKSMSIEEQIIGNHVAYHRKPNTAVMTTVGPTMASTNKSAGSTKNRKLLRRYGPASSMARSVGGGTASSRPRRRSNHEYYDAFSAASSSSSCNNGTNNPIISDIYRKMAFSLQELGRSDQTRLL